MSDYEKELEKTIETLQSKLQETLETQERLRKKTNAELYDMKSLVGSIGDKISILKRNSDADWVDPKSLIRANMEIEKSLLSSHDALHDRVLNLLDLYKE